MAEYIEREALVHRLKDPYLFNITPRIFEIISEIPAADVAPVVHGRWDDSIDGITPYCSICGQSHRMMIRTPNYCPNCGAKMIEGDG